MPTPSATLPAMPDLPIDDYASYRELALNVLAAVSPGDELPAYFAPRPMAGTLTFGAA